MNIKKVNFQQELSKYREAVKEFLVQEEYKNKIQPEYLREAVYSYLNAGGKYLRPALLLLSCGAVGGDEQKAIPAAAAVEIYHTCFLVHDDILDRDERRRGRLTVHEEFRQRAMRELGYPEEEAKHFGVSMAILAGDVQHGSATALLTELWRNHSISAEVCLALIYQLETEVMAKLVEGETLDILYSHFPFETLTEEEIIQMLWKKTGAIYEFAGRAGAMIGLNTADSDHPWVIALSQFASLCGLAFQLQDDILGIVGDEKKLGKPVGSDIREGKRTTIVYYVFRKANQKQKNLLLSVLGNRKATPAEIEEVASLLKELGGINHTMRLAKSYLREAQRHLKTIPPSRYRDLLSIWADYMLKREF